MRLLKLLLAAAILAACSAGLALRGSLPRLDGATRLPGLSAPVSVERDARGTPTLRGATRRDLARALGFVHGQDRFFQMDLLRRYAAGELAELAGPALVAGDRARRFHRLRSVARAVLVQATPAERGLLRAYVEGVNAGLASLRSRPPEYWLAGGIEPRPWSDEDSVLTVMAMWIDLTDENGDREARLGLLREALPPPLLAFLLPDRTEWDAPLEGELPVAAPPLPGPQVYDLRKLVIGPAAPRRPEAVPGLSNAWALGGSRTGHGGALVANDPHLALTVPNLWYRARLVQSGEGGFDAVGVTLPGAPQLVLGSNGRVAWSFTNAIGDWTDLVEVLPDPSNPDRYQVPGAYLPFTEHREWIRVRGREPVPLVIRATQWGPLLPPDRRGRLRAVKWLAHEPAATNLAALALERAGSAAEALAIAQRSGIPPQNFIAGDAAGHIGWTILGRLPRRAAYDAQRPSSWADHGGWTGWLPPAHYPLRLDPPGQRLWSANARLVAGAELALLGDGGYAIGSRQQQIRDALRRREQAGEREMLALQLDDRAVFLSRWRDLLLSLLAGDAVAESAPRAEARRYVEEWGGRAAVDSVGYRLVREWHDEVESAAFAALTAEARKLDPDFRFVGFPAAESALWRLVTERPVHLLDPRYPDWPSFLLAAFDRVLKPLAERPGELARHPWGEYNTLQMRHRLSPAMPWASRWLDMPAARLPGDRDVPRLQLPMGGASLRMAVSPGREAEGYLHLPGGQSGHPFSPYYRAGHDDWVHGVPTPLLPGQAVHRLVLEPAR